MQTFKHSLKEVGQLYIDDLALRTSKKSSVADARCSLQQLLRAVPELETEMIDRKLLRKFIRARRAQGIQPTTINSNLRYLKAALRWGKEEELYPQVPVKIGAKIWLKEPKKRHRFLTMDERGRILQAAKRDWRLLAIIKVAMFTGCRADELIHLQIKDVDFEGHSIHIACKPEFNWEPKNWGERVLPVPPELTEWLQAKHLPRLTWAEPDDFLLPHKPDVPGPPIVRRWSHQFYTHLRNKVFDPAGIDRRLKMTHLLRATYITDLLQHASVETVRQIVGHSAAITTIGYASALEEHKVDAIRKVFAAGAVPGLQNRREV